MSGSQRSMNAGFLGAKMRLHFGGETRGIGLEPHCFQ